MCVFFASLGVHIVGKDPWGDPDRGGKMSWEKMWRHRMEDRIGKHQRLTGKDEWSDVRLEGLDDHQNPKKQRRRKRKRRTTGCVVKNRHVFDLIFKNKTRRTEKYCADVIGIIYGKNFGCRMHWAFQVRTPSVERTRRYNWCATTCYVSVIYRVSRRVWTLE